MLARGETDFGIAEEGRGRESRGGALSRRDAAVGGAAVVEIFVGEADARVADAAPATRVGLMP